MSLKQMGKAVFPTSILREQQDDCFICRALYDKRGYTQHVLYKCKNLLLLAFYHRRGTRQL